MRKLEFYKRGTMFKRVANFDISNILRDNDSINNWKDIVSKANIVGKTTKAFLAPGVFTYNPERFLYFTARAISGMEKHGANRNGDAFPWEELKGSHETFVGKGFYIEHVESSIEDAKGLVLDSVVHEDEHFIECLCAVDKILFPQIAGQILGGIINAVSMSCNCQTAECSECGTIATNASELCVHCRQYDDDEGKIANVNYCKGRLGPSGKTAYEINRGITFTGLSGVGIPADAKADIFEVFASMKGELEKHLFEYQLALSQNKKKGILKKAMSKMTKAELKILAEAAKEVDSEKDVKEEAKEIKEKAEEGNKLETIIEESAQKVADNAMKSAVKEVIEEKMERMVEPQTLMVKKVVAPKVEEKLNEVIPQIEVAVKELAGGTPIPATEEVKKEASTTITIKTDEAVSSSNTPAVSVDQVEDASDFKEGDLVILKDAQERTPAGSKVKVLKKLDEQEQKLTYKDFEVVSDSGETFKVKKDDIVRTAAKVEIGDTNVSWEIYVTPTKEENAEDILEKLTEDEDLYLERYDIIGEEISDEPYIVLMVSAETEEKALEAVKQSLYKNNITVTAGKIKDLIIKKAESDDSWLAYQPKEVKEADKKEINNLDKEIKEVALGDGWILKQVNVDNKIMMEVFDRDESTGQHIEMLPNELTETERVTKYREILDLNEANKENIKEEVKKMSNLIFKYIPVAGKDAADSLDRSFFVAKAADNKKMKIVKAKYIISQEEGDAIVAGKSAIEPEEYCKKLAEQHTDYDAFVKHASSVKEEFTKQASVKVQAKEGKSRFSQFSFNEKEVTKEKQKEAGDKPVVSVDEKEANKGKSDSAPATAKGHGARIKQLYSRLPSNTSVGGTPTEAIDRKSKSLGEHARILRQAVEKQRLLEAGIKERDQKIALMAKENEDMKKEKEVDAKAEIISEITSSLKDSECKEKVKEQLTELDEASLKALKSVLDLMNEKEEEGKPKDEELNAEAGLDFDQVPSLDLQEQPNIAMDSTEAIAQAWAQNTIDKMQGR